MTINNAMNISLSGLKANQAALNVVSHNIANMNTEGYVKQRVNFAEVRTPSDNTVSGQIASLSGVKISGITTSANDYLNNYYRTQNSDYQSLLADADTASQISDLMDELKGSGLGDSLTAFYNAANSLNQNPTDYSLRVNFVEKAKSVANKFNTMYSSVEGLKETKIGDGTLESAQTSQAGTYVSSLNDDLEALLKVNKQISANPDDASLKTQRDQILADLSGLANVTTSISSTGTASVKLGDTDLLLNNELEGSFAITASGTITFTNSNGSVKDVTSDITGGQLGGTLSGLSSINDTLTSIDKLAAAFAQTMNDIQTYSSGNTVAAYYDRQNDKLVQSTENLFTTNDGSSTFTASNIAINSTVYDDPDLVAAARADSSVAGWDEAVGNGDNAIAFYTSQSEKIPSLGYLTIGDYITSLSTRAALNAASKAGEAETQGAIVDGIQNQILAETGVNLDEELANMIMYQQAYNASARVFAACVEVYDTLVALGS
ncbi:flagellar hook-associated protein FlgK [bacterium]|nr:flagellar hook-associated protein FlgK [bacterium]